MEKVNFRLSQNLIYLNFKNRENIFNNNIIYFQDLDIFNKFYCINEIENLSETKNYILFVNKLRDKDSLNLILKLKEKLDLKAINLSLECFWYFLKIDGKCEERIVINQNNFNIDLNFKFNSGNETLNILKKNVSEIEDNIKKYQEDILNESIEKLKNSYSEVKNKILSLKEYVNNFEGYLIYLNKNKKNIEREFEKNQETIIKDIRLLKKEKDKLIKETNEKKKRIKKNKNRSRLYL